MSKVAFEDKVDLVDNPTLPEKNKLTAQNINDMKKGINDSVTVKLDDAVQEELTMSTTRNTTSSKVFVQLKDTEGRLVMIEASYENVYLKNNEGNEISLKDYASLVSKCINGCALFNVDFDVSLLTDLNKFAVTEIAAESEEQ